MKQTLEQRILNLLKDHCINSQCNLTNKEIMDKVEAKSTASVDRALARLKVKNLIETKNKRVILIK
ncbi:MAG: LexA binding domain [Pseudomonadota bacterium]|jgi:SOS-response transcriptional repressor LexA